MPESKRKLVIGIVAASIIGLMFVVGAGLVKKIAVGPDRGTAPVSNVK